MNKTEQSKIKRRRFNAPYSARVVRARENRNLLESSGTRFVDLDAFYDHDPGAYEEWHAKLTDHDPTDAPEATSGASREAETEVEKGVGDFVEILVHRKDTSFEAILCLVEEIAHQGRAMVAKAIAPRFPEIHGVRDGEEVLIHHPEIVHWLIVKNEAQRKRVIKEAKRRLATVRGAATTNK